MHWWHGAFKSTSKLQSSDDSIVGDRASEASIYSGKPGFFSSRRSRMLMRARKLMHAAESDVEMWRSPADLCNSSAKAYTSAPASAQPQPLPLPELSVLLQRDPKYASSSLPLPSPEAVHVPRGCEDKERDREGEMERSEIDVINELKRLVGQDTRTNNKEHSETRPSRQSRQSQTAKEKYSHIYNISIPISAPTTPYSSLASSPPRNDMWSTKYMPPPGVFQAWSAPEMPHSDDDNNNNNNLGLAFYCQTPPERNTSSVHNSPLQSPQRPLSPLAPKITSEIPLARWETSVHPLPLPPGPISPTGSRSDTSGTNMTLHHSPLSPVGSKPVVMPRKSKWQKGKLIGRGTFGSVYVASNRETGALCAMKEVEILPDDSKSAECMRQLEQEIKVLQHLKHPNIVQYYGSEIVGDKFYIYLEYVHPGSINKFIQDHCGAITESVVRNFTRHILCGLAYLHSKKTIHRDIKGANLLVDAYGVVKLADFGMAKHLNGQTANLSLKGSPYWMAPELLQHVTQSDASSDVALAVDIWSLGCTIIEMMNGKPPWSEYEGAAALFRVLTESPSIPNTMSAEGQDFLQCCFRRNPADRPTASMLLDHPFVNYSHRPHACTQSLNDMNFTDNMQFIREWPRHKSDQTHGPYDITHWRLNNNFVHDSFSRD